MLLQKGMNVMLLGNELNFDLVSGIFQSHLLAEVVDTMAGKLTKFDFGFSF